MKIKNKNNNKHMIFSHYNNVRSIYFIGIGGIGMCGIAKILLQLGYHISGSDLIMNIRMQELILLGAKIYLGHNNFSKIKDMDIIVFSTAIKLNNPELVFAKQNNILVLHRAIILADLMKCYYNLIVSGTHGKTTTTAMIIEIFLSLQKNPTFINGGVIKKTNLYANLGTDQYFITEADESDKSFLSFNPIINITTNIDFEHLEYYKNNINVLKDNFITFFNKVPFYGCNILCIDNIHIRHLLKEQRIHKPVITYGFHKSATIQIYNYIQNKHTCTFNMIDKTYNHNNIFQLTLNIPGKHNALNATASFALARYINFDTYDIIHALKQYSGVKRRYDIIGEYIIYQNNNKQYIKIMDDYGHHPTEINNTIKTIRQHWPKYHLIMVFQPHKYSRIHNLLDDFIKILATVDTLFILDVYSAGEAYSNIANSNILYKKIKKLNKINIFLGKWINYNDMIKEIYSKLFKKNILLFQGAGDINKLSSLLLQNKFNHKN
ncbi:UDP-N-acetylmuramate--L-alanine ligase [Enterobacteriaceae endosymbiont of Macroplea appendiculata]|uniref:UDP-N-acetylmuramate--L-alanine ligase n=1 Tax=Enterobacteriaceae endosymbiont of Macroplea appendiculata TaxID=2675790 RepID=UPI001449BA7F|nr:UDP-N-acetylmuramate--L-alanine ligase [Enterobacteriaceae endosymbiont of Macroplea appendiculata]QJC30768.1 UDP-N-acetylmuramate--L-alanine ligase [Enterobacteriaceae endosymbiont of Macroplea appendiculata]